jgi:site-specific recombinase
MNWYTRLRELRSGPALDALVAHAQPDQPLAERVMWAEDLLTWVRRDVPATRLRLLFQILDRQPEARTRFARTLRSLVRDTQALDLFAGTGLPRGAAFLHELMSRVTARVLPDPPDTRDLADIFDRLFPGGSDARWLEQLDADVAQRIVALFYQDQAPEEAGWASLHTDLEDAMTQLSAGICVAGSHREMRKRMEKIPFRDLPFQKLPAAVENLLARYRAGAPVGELTAELNVVRAMADACDQAMDEVIGNLEKTGVKTALVYDIERLRSQISRLELLLEAWSTPDLDAQRTLTILADLVRQNHARRSVSELFRQNLHLLTRRIVDRNAETGEHYVARNRAEYLDMLRRASGGGAITGVTTMVKLLMGKLALANFFKGGFLGVNYAISFVLIQLCGCTLATKQPANTAPALARRMGELRTAPQLEALVDEVVFLIRSQVAAIFGNVAMVIPATWLLDVLWTQLNGHHLVDAHKAHHILESILPWNAWIFAAFTGGLLWLSSVIAAWADNWFALHQLSPALAQHRGLQRWLGPTRTRKLAGWLGRNIAGLAGNVSLGLMLGMVPEIAGFFGLGLDVRHVTLSTGQVTASFSALGGDALWQRSTLWIVIGILGIGALNVLVSFSLALFVAIKARNVRGPERNLFYRALLSRLVRSPFSFVLPTTSAKSDNTPAH